MQIGEREVKTIDSAETALRIRNSELKREIEANATVTTLLHFMRRSTDDRFDRRPVVDAIEAIRAETADATTHDFLTCVIQFVRAASRY